MWDAVLNYILADFGLHTGWDERRIFRKNIWKLVYNRNIFIESINLQLLKRKFLAMKGSKQTLTLKDIHGFVCSYLYEDL